MGTDIDKSIAQYLGDNSLQQKTKQRRNSDGRIILDLHVIDTKGNLFKPAGKEVYISFDPGSIDDGAYNIFVRAKGETGFITGKFTPVDEKDVSYNIELKGKIKHLNRDATLSLDQRSFKHYLTKEMGLHDISFSAPDDVVITSGKNKGKTARVFSCQALNQDNQSIFIEFNEGTNPDGTFNVFITVGSFDGMVQNNGVIKPLGYDNYAILKSNEQQREESLSNISNSEEMPLKTSKKPPNKNKPAPDEKPKKPDAKNTSNPIIHPIDHDGGEITAHYVVIKSKGKRDDGKIVICQNGQEMAAFDYISGPWGKGHAPHVAECTFTTGKIAPFYYRHKSGKINSQPGLRIANSSFDEYGRDGILIHCDLGTPGTIGCFGIDPEQWPAFIKFWNSIPLEHRPKGMQMMAPAKYVKLQASSREKDLSFIDLGETQDVLRDACVTLFKKPEHNAASSDHLAEAAAAVQGMNGLPSSHQQMPLPPKKQNSAQL